jgi:hypothetical protein
LFLTYMKNCTTHHTIASKKSTTRWKIDQFILCPINHSLEEKNIHFMLLWNESIVSLVSCPACEMLWLPTHHIVALCAQWSLKYVMNWDVLGYLVAMMSISSCAHKTWSWSSGQAREYMSFPKA